MILPRGLREAWRANLTAFSLASAPPSVKNTRPPSKPDFSSSISASCARGSAPQALVTKQSCSACCADRGDDARMLVAEVAALGEAAHVEDAAAVVCMKPRARAADDRRRGPVGLPAPAVQNGFALGIMLAAVQGAL